MDTIAFKLQINKFKSSIMNIFKLKRMENNLDIVDIAKNICYPIAIIHELEAKNKNFLPKPYAYYCAKAYGEFLNLNNLDLILKEYK